eukprot:gene22780-16580_t
MDAASTSQDGSTEPPSKRRKAPPPPATAPPAVGGGTGAGAGARAGPARSTVQKKEVTQSTPDLHLLSELAAKHAEAQCEFMRQAMQQAQRTQSGGNTIFHPHVNGTPPAPSPMASPRSSPGPGNDASSCKPTTAVNWKEFCKSTWKPLCDSFGNA